MFSCPGCHRIVLVGDRASIRQGYLAVSQRLFSRLQPSDIDELRNDWEAGRLYRPGLSATAIVVLVAASFVAGLGLVGIFDPPPPPPAIAKRAADRPPPRLPVAARASNPPMPSAAVPSPVVPSAPSTSATTAPSPASDCKRVPRRPVASSAILSIGYCEPQRALDVQFVRGAVYRYWGVDRDVYDQFMAAPSKGQFFNQRIKYARYGYARIQ